MKILAVDDDPIFLDLLAKVLGSAGYKNVISCRSAKEAMELLESDQHRFDCFLLDIRMPVRDGIDLCGDIRAMKAYHETPILMITASAEINHIDNAFKAGATDYIRKPLEGLELGSRIRIAKIMSEQTRRIFQMSSVATDRLPMSLIEAGSAFAGETAVHGIAGARVYMALENELLKLAPGSYNLGIFALKIESAGKLFDQLGPEVFHRVLLGVGSIISRKLDLSRTSFTYAGKGIFGCVRFGRVDKADFRRIRETLCRKEELAIKVAEGRTVNVRLVLTTPLAPTVGSGRCAAEALRKTVEKAGFLASDILLQKSLDAMGFDGPIRPRRHKIDFCRRVMGL